MSTSIARLRYLRIAGLAVGSVAVAGAAVLISASASGYTIGFHPAGSTQPGSADAAASLAQASTPSAVCTDFVSHLSSDLGKSQSQITAAIQKAVGETLADEVKNGKLTQAQANAITQRLAKQPLCSLPGGLAQKPATAVPGLAAGYLQQIMTAAAAALGITPAQLRTDLAGGMSLSQIAAAQNPPVSEATFRTRLIAQLKPLLDQAVTNKKLTQTQETKILAGLQTGAIPYWNSPLRKPQPAALPSPA